MNNRLKLLLPIFILHLLPMAAIWSVALSMDLFPHPSDYLKVSYLAGGLLTTLYSLIWLVWNPRVVVRNYWLLNIGALLFYGLAATVGLFYGGIPAPDLGFLFGGVMLVLWLPVSYLFWYRSAARRRDVAAN
ncbi:MAG: hypothetical protein Q4A84_01615 [Neisseria sp.]|uniref:hypothetical protein n=1 Tax=Neisseria sp. TaxID=192066 RepID=UPI0026DC3307|nr:hypothetical protein [Neisseria sp.]MDO4640388.1 hypothetical protein [Neisseria sp.]